MVVLLVIVITSAALILGAVWGSFLKIPKRVEGFIVALAGGALIVSVMDELVRPALNDLHLLGVIGAVLGGAGVFSALDAWVGERFGERGGLGLMLAVTLDGVPENLALGSALIGTGALGVAALAGSIFLSNLPEAAGGARKMIGQGRSKTAALGLWTGVAVLLSLSALAGYYALETAPEWLIAAIRCLAAGAVLASLATEVFPNAFRDDAQWTGIAVAVGLCLALALSQLGG